MAPVSEKAPRVRVKHTRESPQTATVAMAGRAHPVIVDNDNDLHALVGCLQSVDALLDLGLRCGLTVGEKLSGLGFA